MREQETMKREVNVNPIRDSQDIKQIKKQKEEIRLYKFRVLDLESKNCSLNGVNKALRFKLDHRTNMVVEEA